MSQSSTNRCSTCVDSSSPDHDSASSSEAEYLYETYRGARVVVLDDDDDDDDDPNNDKALSQVSASPTGFRFLDLPAELRSHVYSFVLPTNMIITFKNLAPPNGQPIFLAFGQKQRGDFPFPIGLNSYFPRNRRARRECITVEAQLFRVSKLVSNEARSVLYGMNTYLFEIHGQALWPTSMRSPYIFGALGHPDRISLLRNLRRIHIEVIPDIDSHWAVKRQRARLEYLVEILKEHADDDNQKSLLQDLTVDFRLINEARRGTEFSYPRPYTIQPRAPREAEKFMFGLESLAALRGIKEVQVTGLPQWYARCLQLCIQGKGGRVRETDWPLVEVKRRVGRLKKTYWTTLRKWYQPMLNWIEFAERNEIAVPDDISKFWEAED